MSEQLGAITAVPVRDKALNSSISSGAGGDDRWREL